MKAEGYFQLVISVVLICNPIRKRRGEVIHKPWKDVPGSRDSKKQVIKMLNEVQMLPKRKEAKYQ